MKTTILTASDIKKIVDIIGIDRLMCNLIEALEAAFIAYDPNITEVPMRTGFTYDQPHNGLLEWMPLITHGYSATIKVVGYHPNNPRVHEIPTITSNISVYDISNGHLLGLMDGTFLTALRTGATSAVASRILASPQSKVVGIIGAGAQAVTQLHALSTQFNVERVLVCDVINMAATTFSQRTAFMNLPIEVVPSDERSRVVAEADILVTATSNDIGSGPVFEDTETKPWLHINAVGADFPGKIEVPYNLLRRAFVCPDFMAQAEREGECQQLESDEVGPQLYELARNPALYRAYQNKLTVFDSTGWAVEDAVAAQMMLDIAREYGIGQKVAIENLPHDPLNPYDFAS